MTLQRQILFWLACLGAFAAFLWAFHTILMPFVAAMILAYLMDPLVDRIERLGLSRMWATVVILIASVGIGVEFTVHIALVS